MFEVKDVGVILVSKGISLKCKPFSSQKAKQLSQRLLLILQDGELGFARRDK